MSFSRSPHHGGLVVALLGVDLCPGAKQHFHRLQLAGSGGGHERSLATVDRVVRIGPVLDQRPNELGVAVEAREVQRRDAVPVFDGGVGPFLQQPAAQRGIVVVGRPVQGGHAIHLLGVNVRPVFEKTLNELCIPRLSGVGKAWFTG